MAAPPPGADVQDGKWPTAAGSAVIGREPQGSLPCKTWRKAWFPQVYPGQQSRPTASRAP